MTIHNPLPDIPADSEFQHLKARIALVRAARDWLKQDMDTCFRRLRDMRKAMRNNITNASQQETP